MVEIGASSLNFHQAHHTLVVDTSGAPQPFSKYAKT